MADRKGNSRRPQRLEGWRAAVHEYVKRVSEAELGGTVDPLLAVTTDEAHLARIGSRLDRTRQRDEARGMFADRHEATASLRLHEETGSDVNLSLRLHLKRRLSFGEAAYTEERLETDRIWLAERSGRWRITRIEPETAERRPRFSPADTELVPAGEAAAGADRRSRRGPEHPGSAGRPLPLPYINDALLPNFYHGRAGVRYRRDLAAAYADRWWNEPNPAYENFEVNCTNYVSQCLYAGQAPMNYTGVRNSGWWYKGRSGGQELWSYSWAVSNALRAYLAAPHSTGLRAVQVSSPADLQLGDVICYDWDGDGRFQHSTIVTAFDRLGMPLVNANTTASRHRYWDYRDSYAWTERTRYSFFHIEDEL